MTWNLKTVAIIALIVLAVHVTFIQGAKLGLWHTNRLGKISLNE
jgi:hypothetical protein